LVGSRGNLPLKLAVRRFAFDLFSVELSLKLVKVKLMKFIMRQKISVAFLAVIIFSISLVGCSSTKNNAPFTPTVSPTHIYITETIVASATPTPEIANTSIISPKEALGKMFGKDSTFSTDGTKVQVTLKNGYNSWVEINSLICFWEHESEKCIVITSRSEGKCHICGVYIQGAIFQRTSKEWAMIKFNPKIAFIGSFGYVSKGELIHIGDGKYAILLKSGYGNQGYSNTHTTIIAEAEESIGIVLDYFPNKSKDTEWKFMSELNFYPDENNGDYYEIVITYFGTDETGKTPPTQIYTFSGKEYVLRDKQK
jgi:hypothetical protein